MIRSVLSLALSAAVTATLTIATPAQAARLLDGLNADEYLKIGEILRARGIATDTTAGRRVYDPGHPDADAQGYITLPNVNPVTEMVDLITAQRAYEANVTAMQTAKTMFSRTLDLLR